MTRPAMGNGVLHLLIGPVGAGKSTFARRRVAREGGVFFDLDAWMVRLYGADVRPSGDVLAWYLERRERCRSLLWDTSVDLLTSGVDVVLELGLVATHERETYYAKARDHELTLHVYLVDAPRDVRRERVAQRNSSAGEHTQVVPMAFFERASDAWQPPSDAERNAMRMIEV